MFREIQFIKHGNCLDFSIFVVVSSRRCEGLSGGYFIEFLMCVSVYSSLYRMLLCWTL